MALVLYISTCTSNNKAPVNHVLRINIIVNTNATLSSLKCDIITGTSQDAAQNPAFVATVHYPLHISLGLSVGVG